MLRLLRLLRQMQVGLTALKIASAAGRLAGFPIPDIAGNIGQMLEEQIGAMGTVCGVVSSF